MRAVGSLTTNNLVVILKEAIAFLACGISNWLWILLLRILGMAFMVVVLLVCNVFFRVYFDGLGIRVSTILRINLNGMGVFVLGCSDFEVNVDFVLINFCTLCTDYHF